MEKIDNYLKRFTKDFKISRTSNSRYYNINSLFVIRVSDHIGRNSDGIYSIIPQRNDMYIIHKHSNGKAIVLNYERTKTFIRVLVEMGDIIVNGSEKADEWENKISELSIQQANDNLAKKISNAEKDKIISDDVLGIPIDAFSKKQRGQINLYVNQLKKNIKK